MQGVYAAGGDIQLDGDERSRHKRPRIGRAICQFFLLLDIAAACGFIIAGLSGCTWVNYVVLNESTNTIQNIQVDYVNFTRSQGLFYTCVTSQNWISPANTYNQTIFGVAFTTNASSPGANFWAIVNLRWWQVCLHSVALGIAGIVLFVNILCMYPKARKCIPHCEENVSYFGGALMLASATIQLIAMILFHLRFTNEILLSTSGTAWMDIYANLASTIQSQTQVSFSALYALGWCALACLAYAAVMYLARDHTCRILGEPNVDAYRSKRYRGERFDDKEKLEDEIFASTPAPVTQAIFPNPVYATSGAAIYGGSIYGGGSGGIYGTGPQSGNVSIVGPGLGAPKTARDFQMSQVGAVPFGTVRSTAPGGGLFPRPGLMATGPGTMYAANRPQMVYY